MGSVNLYVAPISEFSPGPVGLDVPTSEISVVQINVSECDLPYCTWLIEDGSVHATGELAACPADTADTGANPCVAGTLTFEFTSLTFENGATTGPMILEAGFGPDQPAH